MIRRLRLSVAALLTLACPPALAAPSAADVARAQRLVRHAAALEQRGDLAGAQDDLALASTLDPEPAVVLALAKVRDRLGRLVEAREALTPIVYTPGAPASPARTEVLQLFADLGRRIPRARLVVEAPAGASVTVTLDDEALPAAAERLPIPVDPGHHVLAVRTADAAERKIPFDAVESAEQTIHVNLRPPAPASRALIAQVAPPPPAPAPSPVIVTTPVATPSLTLTSPSLEQNDRLAAARRARFSVGRFFLESLGSAVVGSLAAYGTYKATCGDPPCLGPSFGALGVNILVTPLTVFGLGAATGGDGSFGWAFLGGLVAFSGYTAGTANPTLPLVVGVILMPFTSALMYEISSDASAKRALGPGAAFAPTFAPLIGPSSNVIGGTAGLTGRF